MDKLFDHLLLVVFSKMSHVDLEVAERVCKHWKSLIDEMRSRESSRSAIQLAGYAPPVASEAVSRKWQINKFCEKMRFDVEHWTTRPVFGVYFMSTSFASHVMAKHTSSDAFCHWSYDNRRNFDVRHINYYAYCSQLLVDEMVRANTAKEKRKRLTPTNCLFM
jgi:hypothetical protein